jgi:hypothetical protein
MKGHVSVIEPWLDLFTMPVPFQNRGIRNIWMKRSTMREASLSTGHTLAIHLSPS